MRREEAGRDAGRGAVRGKGAEGTVQKGEASQMTVVLPPRALGAWLPQDVPIYSLLNLQCRQQLDPPSSVRTRVPPVHTAMLKFPERIRTISTQVRRDD